MTSQSQSVSVPAVFSFEVNRTLRVVEIDGDPWFVAADVCAALGISRTDDGVGRLDDDEKGTGSIRTPGGSQQMTIINESGLYSLILGSRKPEAKRFKKWVTAEVLPSLRKTGRYETQNAQPAPALNPANFSRMQLIELAMQAEQERLVLERQVIELRPRAAALDLIATASAGATNITQAAKALGIGPKVLFAWLHAHEWIYRRPGGRGWVAYQHRLQQGLLEHKVTTVHREDGSEKLVEQVLVTGKGLTRLAAQFPRIQPDLLAGGAA